MTKSIVTASLVLSLLSSSYAYACNVVDSSKPDYKLVLRDWLKCGGTPKQAELEGYVADLGFQGSTWDDGRGWENWCDERLPLGKTFAALKLLRDGWKLRVTDLKHLHELTTGAYTYVGRNIETLEFACEGSDVGSEDDASGFTDYGIFSDDTFVFRRAVNDHITGLAATLIHEARHSDMGSWDSDHIDCTKGAKAKDACDSSLKHGGAWAWSIAWRINYAYHGKEAAGQARLTACNNANKDIEGRINGKETLRCDLSLIDVQLPTPKCPSSRASGTLISQSSSSHHTEKTVFSSKASLTSSTSTTCTYSGKITTTYSTVGGSGSSTRDGSKSWPITDFNDTYDDILPSYKF